MMFGKRKGKSSPEKEVSPAKKSKNVAGSTTGRTKKSSPTTTLKKSTSNLPSILPFLTKQSRQKPETEPTHCPFCQLPYSLLPVGKSPERHLTTCCENNYEDLPACSQGLTCRAEIPSHYSKFNHSELARFRDGPQDSYSPLGYNKVPDVGISSQEDVASNNSSLNSINEDFRNASLTWAKPETPPKKSSPPISKDRFASECVTDDATTLEKAKDMKEPRFMCFVNNDVIAECKKEAKANDVRCEAEKEDQEDPFLDLVDEFRPTISSTFVPGKSPDVNKTTTRDQGSSGGFLAETDQEDCLFITSDSSSSPPVNICATEDPGGALNIDMEVKNVGQLTLRIPSPKDESKNKIIDVVGKFRSQPSIQSFFKAAAGSGSSTVKPSISYLTPSEKNEAKKIGFIIPKIIRASKCDI